MTKAMKRNSKLCILYSSYLVINNGFIKPDSADVLKNLHRHLWLFHGRLGRLNHVQLSAAPKDTFSSLDKLQAQLVSALEM